MSFNGSGTFVINTSGQPVVTGTVISSTVFNALTADLATGLSTCITKDGQTTVTANIPFSNFKLTGVGSGTTTGDALAYGQASAALANLTITAGNATPLVVSGPGSGVGTAIATFTVSSSSTRFVNFNNSGTGNISLALTANSAANTATFSTGSAGTAITSNAGLSINATSGITLASATTMSAALTYGGVTLSNSVIGTGSMALGSNGTWTIALTPVGGSITANASFRTGRYQVVGNRCYVSGLVNVSSVSAPTGALQMSLPMASANASSNYSMLAFSVSNLAGGTNYVFWNRISPNSSVVDISKMVANVVTDLASDVQAGSDFYFEGSYVI